ncbi:NCS1 nucleoside transporter [Colletotrichum scovillei]|uniref:NCS1 nucleoside transporter n=1 Tax=Colletotrichum scovillei TaxID=1209932 RepID=A0A9P7UAN3_9PEZI|nr:NCS1 nucleoside transporter [Colletotrichum scovillei]KAF4773960.1 NCS1 nucleoside transporter [Colletotrichum scovillei]KAG7048579.1 NCS1 nucleoside transporter [Colletotrichum scovillei]KAG7065778.1 NCS1 nucleoside transporter [Colletotrichum scovillei]KAG7068348.1 NCS1 nucleoside transporter [Colletotrichum scovillei]
MSSRTSITLKDQVDTYDMESQPPVSKGHGGITHLLTVQDGDPYRTETKRNPKWYQRLLDAGVEENGIQPVPLKERTNTNYSNLFTVFFTSLLCLLPIPTGALATAQLGLSLRDASLVIIFFALLTCVPPAFMGIAGSHTGLRQLVQARYSFGYYLVGIPLLLNAATVTGFSLSSSIVGGQTLAAVNPGHIDVKIGIVIACLVSFAASFIGYRALHMWERWQWLPNLVAIVIAVGCGGKHLWKQAETSPPTAAQILNYGGLMAGYFITFGGTASDFTAYHNPNKTTKFRIFSYIYLGILTPSVPLLILGAAIGGALNNVPEWKSGWDTYGIGGVMAAMLAPAGGFGKFVLVILALSVIGNIATSMYSVALCMQQMLPVFTKVPRIVFVVVALGIMIPMAIRAAESWADSLENFLGLIGYWAGCFDAVIIEELVLFRRMNYSSYDPAAWNVARLLPSGLAAVGASLLSFGLIIPGMDQAWYTGPIARVTGDIGFESAFVLTAIFYAPLRWLETRKRGHV